MSNKNTIRLHAASYNLDDLRNAKPEEAADMVADKEALEKRNSLPLKKNEKIAKVKDMSGNDVTTTVYVPADEAAKDDTSNEDKEISAAKDQPKTTAMAPKK